MAAMDGPSDGGSYDNSTEHETVNMRTGSRRRTKMTTHGRRSLSRSRTWTTNTKALIEVGDSATTPPQHCLRNPATNPPPPSWHQPPNSPTIPPTST